MNSSSEACYVEIMLQNEIKIGIKINSKKEKKEIQKREFIRIRDSSATSHFNNITI